jgi:hypothetical protein
MVIRVREAIVTAYWDGKELKEGPFFVTKFRGVLSRPMQTIWADLERPLQRLTVFI